MCLQMMFAYLNEAAPCDSLASSLPDKHVGGSLDDRRAAHVAHMVSCCASWVSAHSREIGAAGEGARLSLWRGPSPRKRGEGAVCARRDG